jgi:capsular polysaccharide biosynthesis protein
MNLLFSPPSLEDFSCLLKAWRFWLLAALIGALIGAAIYYVAPPPYRARATVLVDFNLEQAWPKDTDRQQFYYLERESRKLEEIAWSDSVLQVVAVNYDLNVSELRNEKLILSQPAEAGIFMPRIRIAASPRRLHPRGRRPLQIKRVQR